MEYVLTIAVSVIASVLAFVVQRLLKDNRRLRDERKQLNEQHEEALNNGLLALLRAQLYSYHDVYIERGYITPVAFDIFVEMYNSYHQINGGKDDVCTVMFAEIKLLPIHTADKNGRGKL